MQTQCKRHAGSYFLKPIFPIFSKNVPHEITCPRMLSSDRLAFPDNPDSTHILLLLRVTTISGSQGRTFVIDNAHIVCLHFRPTSVCIVGCTSKTRLLGSNSPSNGVATEQVHQCGGVCALFRLRWTSRTDRISCSD